MTRSKMFHPVWKYSLHRASIFSAASSVKTIVNTYNIATTCRMEQQPQQYGQLSNVAFELFTNVTSQRSDKYTSELYIYVININYYFTTKVV